MKRLPIAICNDKRPCRGLSNTLKANGAHGGGLHCKIITNMVTMQENPLYVTKSHEHDRGVVLNFCPFCGRAINTRWTQHYGIGRMPARPLPSKKGKRRRG